MQNYEKKIIDKIIWWIPFRSLRDFIRLLAYNIIEINKIKDETKSIKSDLTILENYLAKNNYKIINYNKIYQYDYIISIGENCFCAQMLKENNLRQFSSPFDWLTPGPEWSINNVINNLKIIINKFDNFFSKEDFHYLAKSTNNNVSYANSKNLLHFYYDFIESKDFNDEYIRLKEKYDRRINRLIDLLSSKNNKILLVYIESNLLNSGIFDIKEIFNLLKQIRMIYNNDNIYILYIKHNFSFENDIIFKNFNDDIHLYELNNSDENWNLSIHNTNKILSNYKVTNNI